ncbi:hypothetical protein V2B37_10385 [Natranaerobius thermophilus JW/NM-WN-LF]
MSYIDNFYEFRRDFLKGKSGFLEIQENIQEIINFHQNQGYNKNSSYKLNKKSSKWTILQGDYSYTTLDEHAEFYNKLFENFGEDTDILLTLSIDSADETKRNLQHVSIENLRQIVNNSAFPIQIRSVKNDQRILAEKAFASGISDIVGGAITNSAYSFERVSLEQGLVHWEYIDKLIAFYATKGVIINKEISLPLSGNLIPPCLQIALIILDGLIAVENGVKSITLTYNQVGRISQDISGINLLKQLFSEYLKKMGHDNVNDIGVSSALATWSGGFPKSSAEGYAIISSAGICGGIGQADKIISTSPDKGTGQIDNSSYLSGIQTAKKSFEIGRYQNGELHTQESQRLKIAVKDIVDTVLEKSGQNKEISLAVLEAFKDGILDVPFSSMIENHGQVLPIRGIDGCVRYFDYGKLPLSNDIKTFHEECLKKRGQKEQREPTFQMVIDDIYAAGKGELI